MEKNARRDLCYNRGDIKMNKVYKYTLTSGEKKEITFDVGVHRLAISNANGTDGGGGGVTYTAGENIQISEENVISATDTTYSAGENIEISAQNVISAKVPTSDMSAQTEVGVGIDGLNVIQRSFVVENISTSGTTIQLDDNVANAYIVFGDVKIGNTIYPLPQNDIITFTVVGNTITITNNTNDTIPYCSFMCYITYPQGWLHCKAGDTLREALRDGSSTNNFIEIYKECYLMLTSNQNTPTNAISLTSEENVLSFAGYYQRLNTSCVTPFTYNGKTIYVSDFGGSAGDKHVYGCQAYISYGIMPHDLNELAKKGMFKKSSSEYGNDNLKYFIDHFFTD